jgi:hypothetical protein
MNRRMEGRESKAVGAVACGLWALVLALGPIAAAEAQITSPGGAPPPGNANPGLTITLRVYNYARVPVRTLTKAERKTGEIFRMTGVEAAWIDCRVSTADPPTPGCYQPVSSSTCS